MKGQKRGRPSADARMRNDIELKALSDKRPRKELAYELANHYPYSPLTIQKWISKARANPLPLDKSFSLGALVKYPILPEALPMVMRVWARQTGEEDGFTWSSGFSIRDALWVSRLSHLYDEIKETKARAEAILGAAVWYSVRERAYEATGEDIDTTDLDTVLLENFRPAPTESKGIQKSYKKKRR